MQFLFPLRSIYLSHSEDSLTVHIVAHGALQLERAHATGKTYGTIKASTEQTAERTERETGEFHSDGVGDREKEADKRHDDKVNEKNLLVDYIFALAELISEKSKQLIRRAQGSAVGAAKAESVDESCSVGVLRVHTAN